MDDFTIIKNKDLKDLKEEFGICLRKIEYNYENNPTQENNDIFNLLLNIKKIIDLL